MHWGRLFYLVVAMAMGQRGQSQQLLPDNIGALTVDCGYEPSEDMILTYVGQASAMYSSANAIGCKAAYPTDDREIVFRLVIKEADRENCHLKRVAERAYRINIHVQLDPVLVTGEDYVFSVTCNYANVTIGTTNPGKIEKYSGSLDQPKVGTPEVLPEQGMPAESARLFLQDELTNEITHATVNQRVRLHIRQPLSNNKVCPDYVTNPSKCDETMERVATTLDCDVLLDEPFAACNRVISPERYVSDCERFVESLPNRVPGCQNYWKRDYLCALQEKYECECHKAGVPVSWLPSAQCPAKKSKLFVEKCSLIGKKNNTSILQKGCGDQSVFPTSWQFYSSSAHATRTPYFRFQELTDDVLMINCTVQLCASTEHCEQNCSRLPETVSINFLETKLLSTGPLYLSSSFPLATQAYNAGIRTAASVDRSAQGSCTGIFTPENLPLFIAVILLGVIALVLLGIVVWFSYQTRRHGPKRFSLRPDRERTFRGLSPIVLSGALKSSSAPTLQASHRPSTPSLDESSGTSPLFGDFSPPTLGVDRGEHEISLQICPQLSRDSSTFGRHCLPPPPQPPAPTPPRPLNPTRLIAALNRPVR